MLLLLYALSGLTALAYEVLWSRMLSLQFGVSVWGVVVSVAAFMLGLGLGSLALARYRTHARGALFRLAALEALAAIFSMGLPGVVKTATPLWDQWASVASPALWHGALAFSALVFLALPAMLLGAGFPLVLQAFAQRPKSLALAYGVNTLGAVLGALLPLVLLPLFGWGLSLRLVAFLGLLVAAGFALKASFTSPGPAAVLASEALPNRRSLLIYAAVGATTLMVEIAWTRLFGLVMLRTEYVLALVLAVFLLGLGLGSLLARWAPLQRRVGWLPWLAALTVLASLWWLPGFSAWLETAQWNSLGSAMLGQGLLLTLLTLPATLCFGAWLPLVSQQQTSSGVALYGANSLGAALGAALAGWVFIPWLGSCATLALAAWLMLVLGILLWPQRQPWCLSILVGFVGIFSAFMPPAAQLLPHALSGSTDVYRYEDAVAMTEVVEQPSKVRILLTDLQRRDASTDPDALYLQQNQSRLPLLLHPHPHSVLYLGVGTGISASGALAFGGLDLTGVELSQGAIQAATLWFAPWNQGVMGRMQVSQDDARHYLSAHAQSYDVIVGDLFHPDLAGVSSLLSVQQFARARARLNPDGLFVQWVALNQLDQTSLQVVLRSFRQVFPQGQMFLDGMHLALLGPRDQWTGLSGLTRHWQDLTPLQRQNATANEGSLVWAGRYWGPIPQSAGPVQDEWSPLIEFTIPRLYYGHGENLTQTLDWVARQRPRVEQAAQLLAVPAGQRAAFERAYIGTDLWFHGMLATLSNQPEQAKKFLGMAQMAHPEDYWIDHSWKDLRGVK
jgi:spermidine synthase